MQTGTEAVLLTSSPPSSLESRDAPRASALNLQPKSKNSVSQSQFLPVVCELGVTEGPALRPSLELAC